MRRGTDFVLEQAAWPALLLEEDGRIRRANQAARRVFPLDQPASDLSTIWSPSNSGTPAALLATENAPAKPLQFRTNGGKSAPFFAQLTRVAREGEKYLVLQLFKEPGGTFPELKYSPPPPSLSSPAAHAPATEEFLLQNAPWPALLLDQAGKVLRSNAAAVRAFGSALEKGETTLDKFWPAANRGTATQFLSLAPSEKAPALKFQLKGGITGSFLAQLCPTGAGNLCLQLLPAAGPESSKSETAPPSPQNADANQIHKQKLDCALQLARSVALDFNNALTSILGHTSLLLAKTDPGHAWRNSLVEIEKSAAKAAEIAADLAAFSRQEKETRAQVAGNLNTLLDRALDAFQASLAAPITISRHFERKLFAATFDEAKIQQALIKLLENAVEAIHGQGKISVQTRNIESSQPIEDRPAKLNPGNYVCVEITDTGQGIAPDIMPKIFEPFFTTKGAGHRGLGLAWVYGIVTNHGGGVAVSSQAGGASVRVYLPGTGRIARETPAAPTDLTGTETILLVDDEDLLLTMGQMVLSSFGYTVLTANSGAKALEIFSNPAQKIHLVITDLVMPNMSGRELSDQILKMAPGTPILWSSGYVRGSEENADRYLAKPFSSQDLLRKVKQVLSA